MSHWRSTEQKSMGDLKGPPVMYEFMSSLRVAGQTLTSHSKEWVRNSGVPQKGVLARMHGSISEILRYLLTYDQLDPTQVVGAELCARNLVLLEVAVERNPKSPDWEGLDIIVSARVTEGGRAEVLSFSDWMSTVQRDRAIVLKQGRLLREERAAEKKRRGDKDKDTGDH